MAEVRKILAQTCPTASTLSAFYAPAASCVVSTLEVCNQTGTTATFRLAVVKSGVTIASSHYVYYDTQVWPNDTLAVTAGWTLASGDTMSVNPSVGTLSFTLFGVEIS